MDSGNYLLSQSDKNVRQIVSFCGSGKLGNNNECSTEFRDYLTSINESLLWDHANYCLENAFEHSGFVLQDIVNEIGRRIGYRVENGLYTGTKKDIGFDGLWKKEDRWIVAEVKTTDAYRINLDTLNNYAEEIRKTRSDHGSLSILIIVGRDDTGDMEAQIRGSRHAGSIRLISIDALVQLMYLRTQITDRNFDSKINRILVPFEYTRVDNIVDLMFETQRETEKVITGDEDPDGEDDEDDPDGQGRRLDFTPRQLLDQKKRTIAAAFFEKHQKSYVRINRTFFQSDDGSAAIAVTVSKRYANRIAPYWYGLDKKWIEYLSGFAGGFCALGLMDRDLAYCLPIKWIQNQLHNFGTTDRGGQFYWHIELIEHDGKMKLYIRGDDDHIDISPYVLHLPTDDSSAP